MSSLLRRKSNILTIQEPIMVVAKNKEDRKEQQTPLLVPDVVNLRLRERSTCRAVLWRIWLECALPWDNDS